MIKELGCLANQLINYVAKDNTESFKNDFEKYKTEILADRSKRMGLLKSLFIRDNGLLDLVLFGSLYNCSITFRGINEVLNSMTTHSKFKKSITVSLNDHFEYAIGSNHTVFEKSADPHKSLEAWIIDKATFFDSWAVKIMNMSDNSNFDMDHLRHINFLQHYVSNEMNSSEDCTNADIIKIQLDKHNSMLTYDIDGLSGSITAENTGCIKKSIRLKYSASLDKVPWNKNMLIQIGDLYYKLQKLHCWYLGDIEISSTEKINFYFVPGIVIDNVDESVRIRNKFEEILSGSITTAMNSEGLLGFRNLFSIRGEIGRTLKIDGYFDENSLLNLLKAVKEKLGPYESIIYFEVYNCKNIFYSKNLQDILHGLESYFNLSRLVLDIDITTTLYPCSMPHSSIFFPKNRFKSVHRRYTLLNCDDLNNYNFSAINYNKSIKKEKVKIYYNGLTKVNFYNTSTTAFIPRALRKTGFPKFSALKAIYNFLGDGYSVKLNNKLEKYTQELRLAACNLDALQNRCMGIRFEMTIKSFNIIDYMNEIENIMFDRMYYAVDTTKIIETLRSGFLGIIEEIQSSNSMDIKDIARMVYNEILYFEFNVRGGKNLHILPSTLREHLNRSKQKDKIELFERDKNISIGFQDSTKILKSLLHYSEDIFPTMKDSITKITELLNHFDDQKITIATIISRELMESISRRHKISKEDLLGSEKPGTKFLNTPILFEDLFSELFVHPDAKNKKSLYFILSQIANSQIQDYLLHDEIKKAMTELKITKFICKSSKESSYYIRFIDFRIENNSDAINDKIAFVRSQLRIGSFQEDIITLRELNVSETERLLYYTVSSREYGASCQKKIYRDFRLPFYVYCSKNRLYYIAKNIKTRLSKSLPHYQLLSDQIEIGRLGLYNFINFLNINKQYLRSPEAVKDLDEVIQFAKGKLFVPKDDLVYIKLFFIQELPVDNTFDCLLKYGEFEPSRFDSFFAGRRIQPALRKIDYFDQSIKDNILNINTNEENYYLCDFNDTEDDLYSCTSRDLSVFLKLKLPKAGSIFLHSKIFTLLRFLALHSTEHTIVFLNFSKEVYTIMNYSPQSLQDDIKCLKSLELIQYKRWNRKISLNPDLKGFFL